MNNRVGYDVDFCRQHEGYANLVVHASERHPIARPFLPSIPKQALILNPFVGIGDVLLVARQVLDSF